MEGIMPPLHLGYGLMSTNTFMEGVTSIFFGGITEPWITFAFMEAGICAFNLR